MDKLCIVRKTSALLLALSITASFSGCNQNNKNGRDDSKTGISDTKTDKFSAKKIDVPVEFSETPEFLCSSDKIYLSGYSEPGDGSNTALTFDIDTGQTQKVDVSGVKGKYIVSQCMHEDMIYLSYHNNDDDNDIRLCCLNTKTSEVVADISISSQAYITSMQFDTKSNRLITMNQDSTKQPIVQTLNTYDPQTLELIDSVDLNEKLSLGENDYLNSMLIDDQGEFYFVSYKLESTGSEYTLYKMTSELEKIYTINEFGDAPGDLTGALISSDGTVCIITVDYENKKCYINKLNAADGQSLGVSEVLESDMFAIFNNVSVEGYDLLYSGKDGIYGYTITEQKSVLIAPVETTGNSFEYCSSVASYKNKLFMLAISYETTNQKNVYVFDNSGKHIDTVGITAEKPQGYIQLTGVSADGTIYGIEVSSDEEQNNYSTNYSIHKINSDGKNNKTYSPDQLNNMKSTYIEKMLFSPDNDMYLVMSQYQDNGEEKIIMVFDSEGKFKEQITPGTDVFDIIFTEENDYIVCKDQDGKVFLSQIDYDNKKVGEKIYPDTSDILKYSSYSGTGKFDAFYKSSDGIYGYNLKEKKSACLYNKKDSGTDLDIDNFFVMSDDKIAGTVFDTDKALSVYYILTRG